MANDVGVDARDNELDAMNPDEPTQPIASEPIGFGVQSRDVVPVIAILCGVASALSGQQPTGNAAADVVLPFALGAGVVWLAQRATPRSLLISSVLALFFTGLQLPAALIALAAVASAVLFTSWRSFDRDSWEIGAAITAAFLTQAALNLPNIRMVGSASILAGAVLAPVVVTGFGNLDPPAQRRLRRVLLIMAAFAVVATILVAIVALGVRSHLETGIEQAEDGVTAVEAGDQPQAVALLEASQQNFELASNRLAGPLTWPARVVPIVAQHARAFETAADQGVALADAAARTVTRADVEKIRGLNGEIDLAIIEAVNAELTLANLTVQGAQQALVDVDTPWLLPQLSSRLDAVQTELTSAGLDIDLANHGTSVLPPILGADGLRRYLVLFMQPAESRSLGGFVGAYGFLEVDQGRFTLTESGSADVGLGSGTASFSDPGAFPDPYVSAAPNINPQNLTAAPDLSTVAAAAREFVPQWRTNPLFTIDGVITLDPFALAGVLELTGPIAVEGRDEPIDSSNVVEYLLREQYLEFDPDARDERQEVLQDLAGDAFNQLFSIDIPGPERLGAIFGPAARANRLSFVTFDDAENAFLDRILLSADLPQVGSAVEMLGIFGQTSIAGKLDGYGSRSTTYEVLIDPATGVVNSELQIVERNDAPADASYFVLGKPDQDLAGEPLAGGTNLLSLAVLTRAEIANLQADTPFRTAASVPAHGYDYYPILVEVPLGETVTVSMTTRSQVIPGRYDLLIPAQASANVGKFTLVVRTPPGWRILDESVASDGSWTRSFELHEAQAFTFNFEATR